VDISGVTELYLLQRSRVPLWLAPDSLCTPTVLNPQPQLIRAAYVLSPVADGMPTAKAQLTTDQCPLFAPTSCPDGPPYRSGLIFAFDKEMGGMSWQDGPHIRHGDRMRLYRPTKEQEPWMWMQDWRNQRPCYFLTGTGGDGALWRMFRLDTDAFHRTVVTLAPVLFSAGCPRADFSKLSTRSLIVEVEEQYAELSRAIAAHSYREVVTKAKNVVEALVSEKLGTVARRHDLHQDLEHVKELLDDAKSRKSCGWTDLEYHLANKIRLVHGQTHPKSPVQTGRPLRPEFALSTVEDLIELLRIWGFSEI